MLMDPSLTSLTLRMNSGDDSLTDVECFRFYAMQNSFLVGMDHMVWLHDNRILDDDTYEVQIRVLQQRLRLPGTRAAWQLWKPLSTPAFRKVVDEQLASVQPRTMARFAQDWKAAMDATRLDRANA